MMKSTASCLLLPALGCAVTGPARTSASAEVPLFDGLGTHHREVTTDSPLAQRYFDQGLVWAYGFNHGEAIRAFQQAARIDPECAMAWWGIAYCNGPHINNPAMTPEQSQAAWDALQKAIAVNESASPVERALIDALSKRYAYPPPEDRKPLDEAYANAMREVWLTYRDDPDVGTLYAESLMDLRPWDLWTDDGRPQPGTERIIAVLEEVMRVDPDNPGANHLYIHTLEASLEPQRANAAADRLRRSVPASSHLVHMPSHVDVLTGRWAQASAQNELAIEADRKFRAVSPDPGFYHVYMMHNHHMLAFASMMEGRKEAGLRAARDVVRNVPEEYARENAALVDPYISAALDVMKRFGMWDALLREPQPPDYLPISNAMWRFHRALAYAAKGELDAADREQAAFRRAKAAVPADAMMAINPAEHVLSIADHMLAGEIAFARGNIDEAVAELRKGIEMEDQLKYMEPPEWIQPVRHTLGAVLLSAGRYEEAEKAYREDLANWPNNGWSLQGLAKCLRARGAHAEATEAEKRFREVWSRADVQIRTSCLCVPST